MRTAFFKTTKNAFRLFCLMVLFIVVSAQSFAESENNEYNIKAMFVLNFMKYVEWPQEPNSDTFKIGVVGESNIYQALLSLVANRKENSKIKIYKVNTDLNEEYQILIIARNENNRIESLSKKYQGKGTLIISEECKNNNNASINLVNINNKIRFEINNIQAKLGGIKISSKLSEMAISVQP